MIIYKLVNSNGEEINRWPNLPGRIDLPTGDVVFSAEADWTDGTYTLIEVVEEDISNEDPLVVDPEPPRTPLEKLNSLGFTVTELKTLLGI